MTDNKAHNPWNEIDVDEYEAHMGHQNVYQLQTLNEVVEEQLDWVAEFDGGACVAVLGVTAGNGLEHMEHDGVSRVIGIDISAPFLAECARRYAFLGDALELQRVDLTTEHRLAANLLDCADLIIANLVLEHIHLDNFCAVLRRLKKRRHVVSCVIQHNPDGTVVSHSGSEDAFEGILAQLEEQEEEMVRARMLELGYTQALRVHYPLPSGKSLIRLDFLLQADPAADAWPQQFS